MAAERGKDTVLQLCVVDVDNPATASLCEAHGVSCMPTLALVEGGTIKDKMEGVDKAKLDAWTK